MAKSGTVRTTGYDFRNWRVAVDWSITQDIRTNTSNLYYKIYAPNDGYPTSWAIYYNTKVTINGAVVYNQGSYGKTMYRNDVFKTGYIKIPHNDDGTKSVVIAIESGITTVAVNRTISQTVTLDKIQRGIKDLSLGTGWEKLSGSKRIHFTKLSDNAVYVYWKYWDYTIGKKSDGYKGFSPNPNPYATGNVLYFSDTDIEMLKKVTPNRQNAWLYVVVEVWTDTSANATKIETHEIEVQPNLEARFPTVNFTTEFMGMGKSVINPEIEGIQNAHRLVVTPTVATYDYSKISSILVHFDGQTQKTTNNKSVTFNTRNSGVKEVSVDVTDSRGYMDSKNKNVDVIAYSPPTSSNYRVFRSSGSLENPLGTVGQIEMDIKIHQVSTSKGTDVNSAYWRLDLLGTTWNKSSRVLFSRDMTVDETQDFVLEWGDMFTVYTITGTLPSANIPLVLGKRSVGIGMVPPENVEGLWSDKETLNGKNIVLGESLVAATTDRTTDMYINRVKENWDKIQPGVSIHELWPSARGVAIVHKYPDGDYGTVLTFGWTIEAGEVRRYAYEKGIWYRRD